MTEMESVDSPVPLEDGGTWRLLLTQLHRDNEGNPESFVLAYIVKRVLRHGDIRMACGRGIRAERPNHSSKDGKEL